MERSEALKKLEEAVLKFAKSKAEELKLMSLGEKLEVNIKVSEQYKRRRGIPKPIRLQQDLTEDDWEEIMQIEWPKSCQPIIKKIYERSNREFYPDFDPKRRDQINQVFIRFRKPYRLFTVRSRDIKGGWTLVPVKLFKIRT